ncbi:MAG: histidine--tRNA ligase [Prevotellaceae bacterium]|jgi:histidyl-tRNA synthetase|nr:histidine--tRNA ligase [Prevotellaceae bacterium]
MQKHSIPKGTRDFTPQEMVNRNYIFDTIKAVFQLFGYQQIETPAMENLSTLLGKYGEEGDKLLFRILNSGNFLSGVSGEDISEGNLLKISSKLCEKGLRYDLTVPFARFVVQHREKIVFPFKRFQIQPVWRADRPQRGRYREFYQCDVDVVGSDSLLNEVELLQIIDEVYRRLKIKVVIKINNRKILSGITEIVGQKDKIIDITVAIDKMEKIGLDKVKEELINKGIDSAAVEKLQPILLLEGTNSDKLRDLRTILKNSQTGLKGVDEIQTILYLLDNHQFAMPVELSLVLARGLNYYTGTIFEVQAQDVEIGSITGGGRYDNLTGIFGLDGVSGVGISFGADRIYDVLSQLNLFPATADTQTKIMFACFSEEGQRFALSLASALRSAGTGCAIFPDTAKMKKQMSYANDRQIPFVAIIGEDELLQQKVTLKNMKTGEQQLVTKGELLLLKLG